MSNISTARLKRISSVLVASDDPVTRKLVEIRLKKLGFIIKTVNNGEDAWDSLCEQGAPQLAVLDWEMPGLDGPEVCRKVRERALEEQRLYTENESTSAPYTFIILLTSNSRLEDLVVGFEAGADDYLTKPFEGAELHARLRAGQRIIELEQTLLKMQRRLEIEATHDGLTEIWNRRAILALLDRELRRGRRLGTSLSALMLDIDHFKHINDEYGHQVGDQVLVEVSKRFQKCIRDYDAIGRYGGEEFVVVLTGCTPEHGISACERIRNSIGSKPLEVNDKIIPVTTSVGVANAGGNTPYHDVETLLRAADRALYRAKEEGRNCCRYAKPEDYIVKRILEEDACEDLE